MKQDETEERLGGEGSAEGRADDTAEDAFKKGFSDGANRRQSIAAEHQGPV